jgi:hypothetical protein
MWQGQGGTVDGSIAGQDRRERRSSPSSTESCRTPPRCTASWFFLPVVSRFQAEREAVEWGSAVWELAETHIRQPKQQLPERRLTMPELCHSSASTAAPSTGAMTMVVPPGCCGSHG